MPVTVSPKYWAEHMGLPYHQGSIRQLKCPKPLPKGDFFAFSSGSCAASFATAMATCSKKIGNTKSCTACGPARAPVALGRPRHGRVAWPRCQLAAATAWKSASPSLSIGRKGQVSSEAAPATQTPPRPNTRLAEILLHLPRLGPPALQPRYRPRRAQPRSE